MLELTTVLHQVPFRTLRIGDYTLRPRGETGIVIDDKAMQSLATTIRPAEPARPEKPETFQPPSVQSVGEESTNLDPLEESKSLLKDFRIYTRSLGVASLSAVAMFVVMRGAIEKSSRE